MSANGRLKASELTTVQAGVQLSKPTAVAWAALRAAAKKELGRIISIPAPAGGYRSFSVQDAMHRASHGTRADKLRWGLNPNSSVSLAAAGSSSHGFGTRVDIVGTIIDARFLALAKRFGFTREFGAADPNHFLHDGHTAIKASIIKKAATAVSSKKVYVTVAAGDTLGEIADDRRTTVAKLLSLNPSIKNANAISIGQKVRVA